MVRITVAPENRQVLFACIVTAPATAEPPLTSISAIVEVFVSIPSTQKIPDFVPDDIKHFLKKFPSILCTGDVMPTPTHGVEHHIHRGSHPPVFAKSIAWIRKNLKWQKRNSNVWNLPVFFAIQITVGLFFCTLFP